MTVLGWPAIILAVVVAAAGPQRGERSPVMPCHHAPSLSGQWDSDGCRQPCYRLETSKDPPGQQRAQEEEPGDHARSLPWLCFRVGHLGPWGPSEIKPPGMLRGATPGPFPTGLLIAAELG